jgi:hypothetical protein
VEGIWKDVVILFWDFWVLLLNCRKFPEGQKVSDVHINHSNVQCPKFIVRFLTKKRILSLTSLFKTTDNFTLNRYDVDNNFIINLLISHEQCNNYGHIKHSYKRNDSGESVFL